MEDNTRSYRTRVLRNLIFPDDFIKTCKDNVNEDINIPREGKKINKANGNGTRIICTSCQDTSKRFEIHCSK